MEFDLEDFSLFANQCRKTISAADDHWPIIVRFSALFDEMLCQRQRADRAEATLKEIEKAMDSIAKLKLSYNTPAGHVAMEEFNEIVEAIIGLSCLIKRGNRDKG